MICCQSHYCHHLGPRQSEDRQNELPQHLSPSAPDPDFEKIIPSTLDVPSSLDNPAFFQMPTHFLTNKKKYHHCAARLKSTFQLLTLLSFAQQGVFERE